MSDNCYRKRLPVEDFSEQESRLTNRHIQTLGLLQDLHRENGELKSRIQELEKELSNCKEFHSIARDATAFKKKVQEESQKKIDSHNERLSRKHKDEMMALISAKLEAETEWLQEKETLQQLLAQHEKQNAVLTEQLETLKKHDLKVDVVNQRLDLTIQEMLELKETNKQLDLQVQHMEERERAMSARHQEQLEDMEREKDTLSLELQDSKQSAKGLDLRVRRLEDELYHVSQGNKDRNSAKSRLREQLEAAGKELGDYQRQVMEMEEVVSDLKRDLQEKKEEVKKEASTKDKLLILLQQMQDECNALREALAAKEQVERTRPATPEKLGFREFVQMKREMNSLKEENNWLKQSNRKPRSLPSLKRNTADIHTLVGGDGHRNQKTLNTRSAKSETALQLYKR
ncbi:uncharacterized protein [Diadema antillarum]|uniref:uncharacterized protein n=1 Tax=Diadema antillarum TaxID=105358 RepID=UPI003A836B04